MNKTSIRSWMGSERTMTDDWHDERELGSAGVFMKISSPANALCMLLWYSTQQSINSDYPGYELGGCSLRTWQVR